MPTFNSRMARFALATCIFGILAFPPDATAQEKPLPIADKVDRYGDPLPASAVARLGTLRFRPADHILALALSPDGKTLASAGYSEVSLWELATGKKMARFKGEQAASLLAFAENGKTLITVDELAILRYRDIATSKIVHECSLVKDVKEWNDYGSITRDGRFLAFADTTPNTICVWDLAARKEVKRLKLANYEGGPITISLDGQMLAARCGRIEVWNVASGKQVHALNFEPCYLHRLAFSPDGKTLVSTGSHNHGTRTWNLNNGKLLTKWGPTRCESGSAFALSNDGKLLATLHEDGEDSLRVWDLATGKELRRWTTAAWSINALAFTADSKMLITAGDESVIRLWDIAGGEEIKKFQGAEGSSDRLVASADGRCLADSNWTDRILLWDLRSHTQVAQFAGASWYRKSTFSPDSKQIAYAHKDHSVRLCETATGKEVLSFDGHEKEVCALAFDLDGKTLLTSHADVALRVRRVADGKELRHRALETPPRKQEGLMHNYMLYHYFSQDSRVLLTMFHDTEELYRTWDATSGRRVGATALRPPEFGDTLVMAPDGRTFAVSYQAKNLWIYEIATGKKRLTLRQADKKSEDYSYGVPTAYSPDGRLLAAGSADNNTIDLWDLANGQLIHRINQVQGGLSAITFVGNGDLLATGGRDTTILLWDVSGVRAKMKLPPLAISAAEFDKLWQQLGSDDPHSAIWKLAAGGDASVQFLHKQVRHAVGPTAMELEKWIGQLQDDNFAVREMAMRKLEQAGELGEPVLRAELDKQPPLEARRRIEVLLEKIAIASTAGYTPERVREMRALEALENIGSASAKTFLSELAQHAPGAWLSKEARASLHRLQNRPQATASRERPSSVP